MAAALGTNDPLAAASAKGTPSLARFERGELAELAQGSGRRHAAPAAYLAARAMTSVP
jgi:hypothetical protein